MKNGKFEMGDLDAMDMCRAILMVLLEKGITTPEEFEEWKQAVLNVKNEHLEKELNDNPGMKLFFDLMSKKGE